MSAHIITDFKRCTNAPALTLSRNIKRKIEEAITGSGMTIVGKIYHAFDGGGYSACIIVSESHVALHTWPEKGIVNADVFFCDYNTRNKAKAKRLTDTIGEIYGAGLHTQTVIKRTP